MGECTPQFGQGLCLLSIHLPAQTAVDVLAALTGRRFARSALQQHVQRDGDALVALEREEAAGLWPWDEKNRIREVRPLAGPPLRQAPGPGDVLIIEMDGVFTNVGREPSIIAEFAELFRTRRRSARSRTCWAARTARCSPTSAAKQHEVKVALPPGTYYRARGCAACAQTGYRGRVAIYEMTEPVPALIPLLARGASTQEISVALVESGMHSLLADGIEKAGQGHTTLDEIMRECLS